MASRRSPGGSVLIERAGSKYVLRAVGVETTIGCSA
jgi:hypothetical protein